MTKTQTPSQPETLEDAQRLLTIEQAAESKGRAALANMLAFAVFAGTVAAIVLASILVARA